MVHGGKQGKELEKIITSFILFCLGEKKSYSALQLKLQIRIKNKMSRSDLAYSCHFHKLLFIFKKKKNTSLTLFQCQSR